MNCYEIDIDISVRYEVSDGNYHYMDPRCTTWTETDVRRATAYVWAESEARAVELATHFSYDLDGITGKRIVSVSICDTDDRVDEEYMEVEYNG